MIKVKKMRVIVSLSKIIFISFVSYTFSVITRDEP